MTYGGTDSPCEGVYKTHADTLLASGQPLNLYGLKCALGPIKAKSYKPRLTSQQLAELGSVFPEGVCNYKKRPVGEVPPIGVWLDYSAGPSSAPYSEWPNWPG